MSISQPAVRRLCSISEDSSSVSPQPTGGNPGATERSSSTEDSGYPHSVCSSERVQEPQSSPHLMQEGIFSSSTSPMEFLSPRVGEVDNEPSIEVEAFCRTRGNQDEAVRQNGSVQLCGVPFSTGNAGEEFLQDFDVLLSNSVSPNCMFEPEDLVMCAGTDCPGDNFMLDSTFNTVDLLDKLNEDGVSIDSHFLDLDVQGMCNSMFSFDEQRSAYDQSSIGAQTQKDNDGRIAEAAPNRSLKCLASSASRPKKKRQFEQIAKPPSSRNVPKALSARNSQSRFGRKITPSWKIRSQGFNYDEEEEMEYIKMVYAQSRKESENRKWEEIERTLLQDWQRFDSGEDNLLATPSGLTSLEDLGMDLNFDNRTFTDFISLPIQQLMLSEETADGGGASSKGMNNITMFQPSNSGEKEGGAGALRRGEGPCWVGKIRVEDDSDDDGGASRQRHNIVVIVRRKKRTGTNLGFVGAGPSSKVRLKEPMVQMVKLRSMPRSRRPFQVQLTSSEDIPCTSGRTDSESMPAVASDLQVGNGRQPPVGIGCDSLVTSEPASTRRGSRPSSAGLLMRNDSLDALVEELTDDVEVSPFIASELPPPPVSMSQFFDSMVESSVTMNSPAYLEVIPVAEDDVVDVVGVAHVQLSKDVTDGAAISSSPVTAGSEGADGDSGTKPLLVNSDRHTPAACSSTLTSVPDHLSCSMASASSLAVTPSFTSSPALTSLIGSDMSSNRAADLDSSVLTDSSRNMSVSSGASSTPGMGPSSSSVEFCTRHSPSTCNTPPNTITSHTSVTSPTSLLHNTSCASVISNSTPTPFCPASSSTNPSSIACITRASPSVDNPALVRVASGVVSDIPACDVLAIKSTSTGKTKQVKKKIIVRSPSTKKKRLSLKTSLKVKPKAFKFMKQNGGSTLTKESKSCSVVASNLVKSGRAALSSGVCSVPSYLPLELVQSECLEESLEPANLPNAHSLGSATEVVGVAPPSPLRCSSREYGVEVEERRGVTPDIDEDFIDVHVDAEEMFSDVEGDTLNRVFVKRSSSASAAQEVAKPSTSKSPVVQDAKQRKSRWQKDERPQRLSVKDRLGLGRDMSYGGLQQSNSRCVSAATAMSSHCNPAQAPPLNSQTTNSPFSSSLPQPSTKSVSFLEPLMSYNDNYSAEPPLIASVPPAIVPPLFPLPVQQSAVQPSVTTNLQAPPTKTTGQHTRWVWVGGCGVGGCGVDGCGVGGWVWGGWVCGSIPLLFV